jgi:hypothetical protein
VDGIDLSSEYVWFDMGWITVWKVLSRDDKVRAAYKSRNV